MYSHLIKGFTLGHTLTRRLGRALTGFPGLLLDAVIVAPLYAAQSGAYSGFWDEADGITYADGTLQRGFFQPLLGWIGDIAGALLGAAIGSILGSVLYVPDGILRLLAWTHDQIHTGFDAFATLVGNHSGFNSFYAKQSPQNYMQKAWNVSVATLGVVLAAPLYAVAKTVEFFLPVLGQGLSNFAWATGGIVGGIVGSVAALTLWPVKHVCNKAVELFRGFREFVRSCSAFVYSRTAQVPAVQGERQREDDCNCLPDPAMHSQAFRDKVTAYNQRTTTQILFGALNVQRPAREVLAAQRIQNQNADLNVGLPNNGQPVQALPYAPGGLDPHHNEHYEYQEEGRPNQLPHVYLPIPPQQ